MRRALVQFAVAVLLAGTAVVHADPAQAVTASGLPWSSGVFSAHNGQTALAFARWRGRPIDNISVYPTRDSWAAMNNPWWLSTRTIPAGFTGDIVVGVPLWPRNSTVTADATAQWRTFASQLARRDPDAYVRLGYEMNIAQWWGITAANQAQWTAAFTRAVSAMKSVAPGLRIVWNPNWGADQAGVNSRAVFQTVKNSISVYAIDMYDAFPADVTDAASAFRMNSPGGLADSLAYAKANGKRFGLPEWGVACSVLYCQWQGYAGGDNPRFVTDMLGFLGAHRADVAFETYHNEPAWYVQSALYPPTVNPRAGAAYRTQLSALSH